MAINAHGNRFQGSRHTIPRGFTLVELLVVAAVISVLMSLSMFGFANVASSGKLQAAGDQLATTAIWARQNAITKNAMTALVILTGGGSDDQTLRSMAIFELTPNSDGSPPSSSNWTQISRWKQIPAGTVIDPVGSVSSLVTDNLPNPVPALPSNLSLPDSKNGTFKELVYLPNGRLLGSASPTLRLIEGTIQNGNVVRTGNRSDGEEANHIDLVFVGTTGRTFVSQP